MGLIFKNETINLNKIEVPAVKGEMGGKSYYMFSIEPSLLLKMGYVLHRTRANIAEFPTYQRLLVPNRLSGITKYIDKGGYFPNSIILSFSQSKHEIQFEPSSRQSDSSSRFGVLKIPNAYAIAYIIDGQHRLYGYANSRFKSSNTIPVVAFTNLSSIDQLEIFMDINQNQKAVSPSLRLDLEEDLLWGSDRVDSRLKALKSSIVKGLASSINSPLSNKISIGEDTSLLQFKPFYDAITASSLLPTAKGNKYVPESTLGSLYNISNQVHDEEMQKAKKSIVEFLKYCYGYVQENYLEIFDRPQYFILSPRGTYAFISLIGSLNLFLSRKGDLSFRTSPKDRFLKIEKYLKILLDYLHNVSPEEESKQLSEYGTGAGTKWLRFFQTIINSEISEYSPPELETWLEMHDEQLQDEGRKLGVAIEKRMKKIVLEKIQCLYKDNWTLEINAIKRACQERADMEMEKNYKEGLSKRLIDWTEMFNINDYKSIIDKYWTKAPDNILGKTDFVTFEKEFSINTGQDFHSKADKIRWISAFNSYRNLWAHEGTKEKRLTKEEVSFLRKVFKHFDSDKTAK